MSRATPVALLGATGRMGRAVLQVLPEFPGLVLTGALCGPSGAGLGRDSGEAADGGPLGIAVSGDTGTVLAGAEVAVDFTLPGAVAAHAAACATAGVAFVCGVTGLEERAHTALEAAARDVPVLWSPNMSAGVAVLARLAAVAAAALGESFDGGVFEIHHRAKRDAPSGTALALAAALDGVAGRRAPTGCASLRGGDVVGEHTVVLAGPGERLELVHRATDRAIFARGALRAAAWLAGRKPGMYAFADVLGLPRVDTPTDGH